MPDKPTSAAGYNPGFLVSARATCLYVATILGDYLEDLVVVGGLVPSLLIDQGALPAGAEAHVGTLDLDVGLSLALLDDKRYQEISERLRRYGFRQDQNEDGQPTRQRWVFESGAGVTIDFLISPTADGESGGSIKGLESDFAAIVAPGLHLAFRDRLKITLTGETLRGEAAQREVWVSGAGAYLALKALAFDGRGENKDAYDLFYVLRNFRSGPGSVAAAFRPLLDDPKATEAIEILRRDFHAPGQLGPQRVLAFLDQGGDDALAADISGFVAAFLDAL